MIINKSNGNVKAIIFAQALGNNSERKALSAFFGSNINENDGSVSLCLGIIDGEHNYDDSFGYCFVNDYTSVPVKKIMNSEVRAFSFTMDDISAWIEILSVTTSELRMRITVSDCSDVFNGGNQRVTENEFRFPILYDIK